MSERQSKSPGVSRGTALSREPEEPAVPVAWTGRWRAPVFRGQCLVSVAAAVLAGMLVVLVGAYVASTQVTTYTATSQLLLAPKVQKASSMTSGLYDTLSSGQLPATAAAIIQEKRFLRSALSAEDASDTTGVSVNVTVVPDTSIVEVRVVAPRSGLAAQLANTIPEQAIPEVNASLVPFELTPLGESEELTEASLSTTQWVVLIGVAALVVGGIVLRLLRPRARRPDELEV